MKIETFSIIPMFDYLIVVKYNVMLYDRRVSRNKGVSRNQDM